MLALFSDLLSPTLYLVIFLSVHTAGDVFKTQGTISLVFS